MEERYEVRHGPVPRIESGSLVRYYVIDTQTDSIALADDGWRAVFRSARAAVAAAAELNRGWFDECVQAEDEAFRHAEIVAAMKRSAAAFKGQR